MTKMEIKVTELGKEPETYFLEVVIEKYQLDYYDIVALKRGHTLNYPKSGLILRAER